MPIVATAVGITHEYYHDESLYVSVSFEMAWLYLTQCIHHFTVAVGYQWTKVLFGHSLDLLFSSS